MPGFPFDGATFRVRFPAFSDTARFPNTILESCWDRSGCYVDNATGSDIGDSCRRNLVELMAAHLCQLGVIIGNGKTPGIKTSASVGGVSVSIQAPPVGSSQWAWWLNLTAYGQQFQACLSGLVAGGRYLFGRRERSAFRKVGGSF